MRSTTDLSPGLGARAADRLAGFPTFLHANGFALGASSALEALDAAERVGVFDAPALRWSLKALLCGRADEWRRFDELFDAWFLPANRWQRFGRREVDATRTFGHAAPHGANDGDGNGDRPEDDHRRGTDEHYQRDTASRLEELRSADFRTLTEREHLLDIEAAMRRFVRRLPHWRERRQTRAPQGRRLHMGATLRASLASGGTPFELVWREARRLRPRLVLLVDVSRSMTAYSFFFLRLARALAAQMGASAAAAEVQTFIFHTRITPVSRALHDPDPWRAQEQLHFLAQGFGGGTRIGECLAQFNLHHAKQALHARTAVLVFSDGYDTGEPADLVRALVQLRRQVRRVVWFNPLAAQAGFLPVSRGLAAALPQVDAHVAAHDLASLEHALPQVLAALR